MWCPSNGQTLLLVVTRQRGDVAVKYKLFFIANIDITDWVVEQITEACTRVKITH